MVDAREGGESEISQALRDRWVKALRWHYDLFNYEYVRKALSPPILWVNESATRLGEWSGAKRTICISQRHILEHPWSSVLETLRHEMAHQYAEEVLGAQGPPHGEAWVRACHLLRVEAAATARSSSLGRLEESSTEHDKMLARVKELLALAGSPNEHEAANAMRMAQKYLLKYNLDLRELGPSRRFQSRSLGRCKSKFQEYEHTLAHILQDHFFVLVVYNWSYDPIEDRRGRVLEISGTPENLDMAEYVFHYVLNLTEPLWKAHCRANGDRSGTRLQYLAGLLRGFDSKLKEQSRAMSREQGLIWLGDPALKAYYDYLNPRVTSGSATQGVTRGEGFAAGLRDGRAITIRRGVGGEPVRRGRLIRDR